MFEQDELSFVIGDRFPSVLERDGDWWKVTTELGREGWVPATYLRSTFVRRASPQPAAMTLVEGRPAATSTPTDIDGNRNRNSNTAGGGGGALRPPRGGGESVFSPLSHTSTQKTPVRDSSVAKALRESRNRRRNRAKSETAPANPCSAFTESTVI